MSPEGFRRGDILVRILGDYGPFSREGKSIGYSIEVDGHLFLLDCGAPLFQQIGGHGLKNIQGVLITHCHDDHKRWFTDLALFKMYAPDVDEKVRLVTSETVCRELRVSSAAPLDRSLSSDSSRVIDIPFGAYVDFHAVGPRARWRIQEPSPVDNAGFRVVDEDGNPAPANLAKVVVHPETGRARLLFRDPAYREWVEPEAFYPFSSSVFYREDRSFLIEGGCRIEAIKAPVWHGVPSVGFRFSTETSSLVFGSDTVNDPALWRRLSEEKRPQRLGMPKEAFEKATVILGDINDLVERTWSRERYDAARTAFDDGVIVHDVSTRYNAVHTDYAKLASTGLDPRRTILTHSPDRIISEWCLGFGGKEFLISGQYFEEVVDGRTFPLDADIYFKEQGRYFVGYRDPEGSHYIYETNGVLDISRGAAEGLGEFRYRVRLFEDLGGGYFPLAEKERTANRRRPDGKVERVQWTDRASEGVVMESVRGNLGDGVTPGEKSRTSVVGI